MPEKVKTIEEMYQHYLTLNKIDQSRMHPNELIERKKTFYGGVSVILEQMLIVGDMDEDIGAHQIESWWQEDLSFWKNQTTKPNLN